MNKLTKILTMILVLASAAMSATLFEVKNNAGAVIMEVSDDGIRVFNPTVSTDTIMCISTRSIKANTANYLTGSSGGYIRDFDIADMGNVDKGRGVGKTLMKLSVKPGYGLGGDSAIVFYKPKNAFRVQTIIQDTNKVGQTSFASGNLCEASGKFSTAMGCYTKADTLSATAFGQGTQALRPYSTAMGYLTKATGDASTALGDATEASGGFSTALGWHTKASGAASTALGSSSIASGNSSTAMGLNTRASALYSTAIGIETVAQSYASVVVGRHNKIEGSGTTLVATDPLFVVGNGSTLARSNAFEVKNNGDTYISGSTRISGNAYIPSLYTTTLPGGETPSKVVRVNEFGQLFSADSKDNNSNSPEISQLQKENDELKAKLENQDSRIAKLEAMLNQMLKK